MKHKLTGKEYAVKVGSARLRLGESEVLSKRKLVTHDKKLERPVSELLGISRHGLPLEKHDARLPSRFELPN